MAYYKQYNAGQYNSLLQYCNINIASLAFHKILLKKNKLQITRSHIKSNFSLFAAAINWADFHTLFQH